MEEDGAPYITVVVAGSWAHRLFGFRYTSKSGCAAIIGAHNGAILYLRVMNKYCTVCAQDEEKAAKRKHICYKNNQGPSTTMEASVLAEGFQWSKEMYSVRYLSYIGDGDSNVESAIRARCVYRRTATVL